MGGGIVGTATAAFLADAGLRVRLYERSAIAAGASGRNSGIVQQPFDPVLAALYRRTLEAYRELEGLSDGAFRLPAEPVGLLYVGRDPTAAAAEARQWAATWPASRPEVLAGPELLALEPTLAPDLVACRLHIGLPVPPASATGAFADLAGRRGVEIVVGGEARPALAEGRVIGIERDGQVEPVGRVVVAAGPRTPAAVDPDGGWRPIRPVWGVVASIALSDAAPRHGLEAIDIAIEPASGEDNGGRRPAPDAGVDFSLVPAEGSSALGSTFLTDEPEPSAWVDGLRRVGTRYVPAIADAPLLGVRHCARPVSRDGRPLVGPVPWIDGLWVCAGHGPWGISTGPGSARLLVDAMLGDGSAGIPAALAVERFGDPATQRQDSAWNR